MPLKDAQKAREYSKKWYANNREERRENEKSLPRKYHRLKSSAKRHNRVVEITLEDFAKLLELNRCSYCGNTLSESGYSIDRKDHRIGYTKENSVACCGIKQGTPVKSCNFRKGLLEGAGFVYPRTTELLLELIKGDTSQCRPQQ